MNKLLSKVKHLSKKLVLLLSALLVAGALTGGYLYFFTKSASAAWPPARRASGSESLMIFGAYYVYLLRSLKDKKYYIGQTENLEKRLSQHNNGLVRSTKHRLPFLLVGFEEYSSRNEARWREFDLKKHSDKKISFIGKFKQQEKNNEVI